MVFRLVRVVVINMDSALVFVGVFIAQTKKLDKLAPGVVKRQNMD
jgi:hypothetical protein